MTFWRIDRSFSSIRDRVVPIARLVFASSLLVFPNILCGYLSQQAITGPMWPLLMSG